MRKAANVEAVGSKRRWAMTRLALLAVLGASVGACAPVFSELQSARLVGVGRTEITPAATANFHSGDGETSHIENHYGAQVATGISERTDIRVRYVRAPGVNVVGVGPKVGLVKDRLAVAMPLGFAFGSDIETSKTWQVHPTLLFTQTLSRQAELNLSAKSLIRLEGGDTQWGLDVGLGLGELEGWVVRPEVGILFDPGEGGHFLQASLGFTRILGSRR
jgi:hypothetical protein